MLLALDSSRLPDPPAEQMLRAERLHDQRLLADDAVEFSEGRSLRELAVHLPTGHLPRVTKWGEAVPWRVRTGPALASVSDRLMSSIFAFFSSELIAESTAVRLESCCIADSTCESSETRDA